MKKARIEKNRLIRVLNLQQNLQQTCSFELRLCYCCDSVSIVSLYLTVISRLTTNTYKTAKRIIDPKVIIDGFIGEF